MILDPVAPLYFEDASRPSPYLVQPRTVYRESYSSETRLQVQVALTREGYYQGDIDGIIGAETRDSISYYQEEHQLPATGFINEPLLESLGIR